MRNLKLIKHCKLQHENLISARWFCVDPDKRTVYFLTLDLSIWKTTLGSVGSPIVELEAQLSISNGDMHLIESFVSFDFIVAEQCLYLGGSNGEIIRLSSGEAEFVDYMESGIKAMSWSPDQELVVVICGNNELLLMNSEFVVFHSTLIDSEQFGESQPVNVGWGKKETQFHGSAGKAAAREQIKLAEPASEADDGKIRISWREDGQFFAFSRIISSGGYRQLRVCSREGIIQYTSEYVMGLEQALFWQPSGALIASSIRKPNKHVIVFFEKNCLQHGEFTIDAPDKFKVREIFWNIESNILAVWLEDLVFSNFGHYIQIWIVNNYHWYFKQSLNFKAYGLRICQVSWDTSYTNQLNILCEGGTFITYTWSWTTSCSVGPSTNDNGVVAVIDGSQVKVTPLRHAVIPPPLCAYSCNIEKAVTNVVFGPQTNCNDYLLVLDDNKILHFSEDLSETPNIDSNKKYIKMENVCLQSGLPNSFTGDIELCMPDDMKPTAPLSLLHWTWSNLKELLFTYTSEMRSVLCVATISWNANGFLHLADVSRIPLEGEVVQMCTSSSGKETAIQLSDGSFLKYNHDEKTVQPWFVDNQQLILRQPCISVQLVSVNSKECVLGYTGTSLYLDANELAAYCTSVCTIDDFILFTTSDHLLHCIRKDLFSQNGIQKSITSTEKLRNVERGSKIVMATFGSKLVFQMPRGNLETIYPRPLVLHVIRQHLDSWNYKEAMDLMRRHRIDMNLFVDNNSEAFLKNVDKFVEQIDDVNLFNLFLSYLSDEDVTSFLYNMGDVSDYNSTSKVIEWEEFKANKVDIICNAFRAALEKREPDKYFLSILTCHVKMKIPQIEIALQKIKGRSLKEQDNALDYLHRLVSVDELFNIALGTYNFQLVTMVAEKTQKDPKDYLPFLNELRKMEPNYSKFTIDSHLKRFVRALEHLIACGDERFGECLSFIESHFLYSDAMKLMPKFSPNYQILLEKYGDFLLKRNLHEEAGILFMKGKIYDKALETFKKCCNWTKAFAAAHSLHFEADSLCELGKHLAANLKNNRRFVDAAYILEIYSQSPEESINCLIEGNEWERAVTLIYKTQALHLIESLLKPALLNHYVHLTSTVQQSSSTFERHRKRLKIVREEKKNKLNENCFDNESLSGDQFSETSSSRGSTLSSMSGSAYTSRTARNRRKLERKRVSLKEGSQFEDLALLEALTQILSQLNNLKDECQSLAKVLSLFDLDEEAVNLQCQLENSFKTLLTYKSDIWPPEESEGNEAHGMGPLTTANMIVEENRRRMQMRKIPPEYVIYTQPPSLRDVNWKLSMLLPSKK